MWQRVIWIVLLLNLECSAELLPRVVIALYDKESYKDSDETKIHQLAEMPLNHLGLKVEFYDVHQKLPPISERSDVLGVITWFPDYLDLKDPDLFFEWAEKALSQGKKMVVMGNPGFYSQQKSLPLHRINKFWKYFGLRETGDRKQNTFAYSLYTNSVPLFAFERKYIDKINPFTVYEVIDDQTNVHLLAQDDQESFPLVVTCPLGGFVQPGFGVFEKYISKEKLRQWYFNPFEFFRLAFDTDRLPKPDCTTLCGLRIYYSHIDGDGWNSRSEVEQYRKKRWIAAKVIQREILEKFPTLPVTCAPVSAELELSWAAVKESAQVAKEIFALPNIEAASHTFSHPFFWGFFKDYDLEMEAECLHKYPHGGFRPVNMFKRVSYLVSGKCKKAPDDEGSDDSDLAEKDLKMIEAGYEIPRAYAKKPFDLDLEVEGALKQLEPLLPPGKKVALYQWSGDTKPFKEAIKKTRSVPILNLNGGDNRFDDVYDSYAWVRPLGRWVEGEQQIYASCSNENTYTDLWQNRFWAFRLLPQTWNRTEMPLRIKPLNLYYHMYSGEKQASLNALLENISNLQKRSFIPVFASEYASICDGFFNVQIESIDDGWLIIDRGDLQTIRFDRHSLTYPDLTRSKGVMGWMHYQGNLFVALDPAVETPEIYLTEEKQSLPSLVSSNWKVKKWQVSDDKILFYAEGFGEGKIVLRGVNLKQVPKEIDVESKEGISYLSIPNRLKGEIVLHF